MANRRLDPRWVVVMAGVGVNTTLGILPSWGIFSAALIDQFGWTATMTQIPYMLASAMFALSMIPGGRAQDRFGPNNVIRVASVLVGLGFVLSGFFLTSTGLAICFGIIYGTGMGIAYASPTPAAVKWFSPKKRGLISGIVISGYGLAPLFLAPLTAWLLSILTLSQTFILYGIIFFLIIFTLSGFVRNPPADHVAEEVNVKDLPIEQPEQRALKVDFEWHETIKTDAFKKLWLVFAFISFSGLMIIGQLAKIGIEQAGVSNAYMLIGTYAVGNFCGRILCGVFSDRFGRLRTILTLYLIQLGAYTAFSWLTVPLTLAAGVALVGFTFGGMLTLLPSITGDYFGIRNFGVNFGMMLTGSGLGGLLGPLVGGLVRDTTGTYTLSYVAAVIFCAIGAAIVLRIRPPQVRATEDTVV